MTIVAADGQDVEPIQERRLLIGVAETYDLLVQIPAPAPMSSGPRPMTARATRRLARSGERRRAPEVPKRTSITEWVISDFSRSFPLRPPEPWGCRTTTSTPADSTGPAWRAWIRWRWTTAVTPYHPPLLQKGWTMRPRHAHAGLPGNGDESR